MRRRNSQRSQTQEPTPAKEPGPPLPDMPNPPKSGALKVPKVEVDGIKDPKLKPPKKRILSLVWIGRPKIQWIDSPMAPRSRLRKQKRLETSIVVDSVLVVVHRSFP